MDKIIKLIKIFFASKHVHKAFTTFIFSIIFSCFLIWLIKSNYYEKKVEEQSMRHSLKEKFKIENSKREYYISPSAKYLKGKSRPLFIFIHGIEQDWPNSNDTKLTYSTVNKLAIKEKFIAIFPKGSKGSCDWDNNKYINYYCWSTKDNKDRVFIKSLKDYIQKTYKTDPKKVYLIGFSNGGFFVVNQIFKHHLEDKYTGYGINSGGGDANLNDPIFNYKEKFPIFMSVGKKDTYQLDTMRYLAGIFLKLGWKQKQDLMYHEFDGVHEINKNDLEDEIYFLLNYKNSNSK